MINSLPKIVTIGKKRIGRGMGSGKGSHTASRGQKGQKTRRKIHPLFEGTKGKKSFIQRLPMQRGKGELKARGKSAIINVGELEILPAGTKIDRALLVSMKFLPKSNKSFKVKVLGKGTLTKKLEVLLPVTKSALEKIEKAGGTVSGKA